MPHFDALKIYSCGKHSEKRRNCCYKQFLHFSQCFLPYMALTFQFKMHFEMFAICFNLNQSTILLSGNGLTLSQTSPGFYVSAVQVF